MTQVWSEEDTDSIDNIINHSKRVYLLVCHSQNSNGSILYTDYLQRLLVLCCFTLSCCTSASATLSSLSPSLSQCHHHKPQLNLSKKWLCHTHTVANYSHRHSVNWHPSVAVTACCRHLPWRLFSVLTTAAGRLGSSKHAAKTMVQAFITMTPVMHYATSSLNSWYDAHTVGPECCWLPGCWQSLMWPHLTATLPAAPASSTAVY